MRHRVRSTGSSDSATRFLSGRTSRRLPPTTKPGPSRSLAEARSRCAALGVKNVIFAAAVTCGPEGGLMTLGQIVIRLVSQTLERSSRVVTSAGRPVRKTEQSSCSGILAGLLLAQVWSPR
jgi:hypothetical protein